MIQSAHTRLTSSIPVGSASVAFDPHFLLFFKPQKMNHMNQDIGLYCSQVYPRADQLRVQEIKALHPAQGKRTPVIRLHANGRVTVQVKGAGAPPKWGRPPYNNTVSRHRDGTAVAGMERSTVEAEDMMVQQLVNEGRDVLLFVYTMHNGTSMYFETSARFVAIDEHFFYLELAQPLQRQVQRVPTHPPPQPPAPVLPQRQAQTVAVAPRQVQLVAPAGQPGASRVNKRKVDLPSKGACQCFFDKYCKKLKAEQSEKPRSRMLVTASR